MGLHEILFLVMIHWLWSEYIVAFDKEMIETIYMNRPWFQCFSFVSRISWFTVSDNFCRSRSTPQVKRFLSQTFRICSVNRLKYDSLNDYFWIQIDNYKKHFFVRKTYRAFMDHFFNYFTYVWEQRYWSIVSYFSFASFHMCILVYRKMLGLAEVLEAH